MTTDESIASVNGAGFITSGTFLPLVCALLLLLLRTAQADAGPLPADSTNLVNTPVSAVVSSFAATHTVDLSSGAAVGDFAEWLMEGGLWTNLADAFLLHTDYGATTSCVVSFFGLTNCAISNLVTSGFGFEFNGAAALAFSNSASWPLTNTIVTVVRPRRAFQNDPSCNALAVLASISDPSGSNSMGLNLDLAACSFTKTNACQEGAVTSLFDDMNWLDYFLGNGSRRTYSVSFEDQGINATPWFDGIQGRLDILTQPGFKVVPATFKVGATNLPILTIGCQVGGTNHFRGSVKVVLVFNKVLTATDFDYVENALLALEKCNPSIPLKIWDGDSFDIRQASTNYYDSQQPMLRDGGGAVSFDVMNSDGHTNEYAWWNIAANGTETIDHAPGGAKFFFLTNILGRLQRYGKLRYEVIEMLGANDLIHGRSNTETINAVSNIAFSVKGYGGRLSWITLRPAGTNICNPPNLYWPAFAETNINSFVYGHVHWFYKIYPADQWYSRDMMDTNLGLSIDGLHMTIAGHQYLAQKMITFDTADSDGDGIPDWWTTLYFGHATGQAADMSCPQDDADADGMSNLQEWLAGTDPTDASSRLYLASATLGQSGLTLSWQSVSGVKYYVQRAVKLSASPAFTTIETNIAGQQGLTTYSDTNAIISSALFYRVGVELQ